MAVALRERERERESDNLARLDCLFGGPLDCRFGALDCHFGALVRLSFWAVRLSPNAVWRGFRISVLRWRTWELAPLKFRVQGLGFRI